MKRKIVVALSLSAVILACVAGPAAAADTAQSKSVKAENTKVNKKIHQQQGLTADQQGQSEADRKITQQIRKALMKNKSLSQYARNVKIITVDANVTLKGPVRSEKEKLAVEKTAGKIAGTDRVISELQVAAKPAQNAKETKGAKE
jgi:osmotically-inducible protein OsmY